MTSFCLPACNARRIFDDLIDIKSLLRSKLSSTRYDQGTFNHANARTKVSPECWSYIMLMLKKREIPTSLAVCRSVRHVVGGGLDAYSVRVEKSGTKLFFQQRKKLDQWSGCLVRHAFVECAKSALDWTKGQKCSKATIR
mmetsp:Transcript_12360/g.19002  ORF Transcript_12360/g.19002 Transcript_12360/m.19002 type:complete len:140 (+) Transcript_12360:549-968(+)